MEINGENFAKCSQETDGPDGPRGVKYDKSFFQTGERKNPKTTRYAWCMCVNNTLLRKQ